MCISLVRKTGMLLGFCLVCCASLAPPISVDGVMQDAFDNKLTKLKMTLQALLADVLVHGIRKINS